MLDHSRLTDREGLGRGGNPRGAILPVEARPVEVFDDAITADSDDDVDEDDSYEVPRSR
jgi:hypothetical protein